MKYEVIKNKTPHTCDWCNSSIVADHKITDQSLDLVYHACNKHLYQWFMPEEMEFYFYIKLVICGN